MVVRVFDRAREAFDRLAQSLQGEDVGDGVCALVGWAIDGVLGPGRARVVWDRSPGF